MSRSIFTANTHTDDDYVIIVLMMWSRWCGWWGPGVRVLPKSIDIVQHQPLCKADSLLLLCPSSLSSDMTWNRRRRRRRRRKALPLFTRVSTCVCSFPSRIAGSMDFSGGELKVSHSISRRLITTLWRTRTCWNYFYISTTTNITGGELNYLVSVGGRGCLYVRWVCRAAVLSEVSIGLTYCGHVVCKWDTVEWWCTQRHK